MSRPLSPKSILRPMLYTLMLATPVVAFAAQTPATTEKTPAKPAAAAPADKASPKDPVVAVVDGSKIHLSDVVEEQRQLGQRAGQIGYADLLNREVNMSLFQEAGRADKLAADPEVKDAVSRLEGRVITEVYLQRLSVGSVTDDMVHARYNQMVKDKQGTEEIHARHILVKTEAEAKAIIVELQKGGDFAKIANDKSEEKGGNGGDLGYFTRDKMVPAFSDAAFALKKGETSQVPVQTQFGWHVIRVEDRRTAAPPTYDEAAPQIRQEIANEAVGKKLHELQAKAKIETFNSDGSPVPPGGTPSVPGAETAKAEAKPADAAALPTPGTPPAPTPAPAAKP